MPSDTINWSVERLEDDLVISGIVGEAAAGERFTTIFKQLSGELFANGKTELATFVRDHIVLEVATYATARRKEQREKRAAYAETWSEE